MDARVMKLKHILGDEELATELVAVGLDTPKKIKAARGLDTLIGKKRADLIVEVEK